MSAHFLEPLVCVLILYGVGKLWLYKRKFPPHPPGPRKLPIIGNLFNAPDPRTKSLWLVYSRMSEEYDSDLLHFEFLGTSLLVLNSAQTVNDLLIGRSAIYSSRPRMPMLNELIGWDWTLTLSPYGQKWRKTRALFQRLTQKSEMKTHLNPSIQACSRKLLLRLLENPNDFVNHIRLLVGDAILSTGYGIEVQDKEDYYIRLAERAVRSFIDFGIPGKYLVDVLPFLKHVPTWLPGANFKRMANIERQYVRDIVRLPMEHVKAKMEAGSAAPSMVSQGLQQMIDDGSCTAENVETLANAVGVMYSAGTDTVVSVITTIFLAILQNPHVLKKVQDAINGIIGTDRLPDFKDEGRIPYVEALIREALRWRPVLPLSLPHCTMADDIYRGYNIPANTTVLGNAWAILHDTETYGEDAEIFRPERFLNPDGTLDHSVPYPEAAFGFGRRTCVGRNIADSLMWMSVVSILACFDIQKSRDENGVEVEVTGEYIGSLAMFPASFQCDIRPRSKETEGLIRISVL